ncbi:MAG: RluA family pseudouridine synthase [Eubacteriales bacterium]|nr:RluA family pseudouridine synthase [Eubacteriales bacterium]
MSRTPFEIVYEDAQMIVCRKPAGLAVQTARVSGKDLESLVKTHIFEQTGKPAPYLGIIHRLDQPVQGLVVFAKDPKSAASLSTQVQDGRMKKYYRALVCAEPAGEEGTLCDTLKKEPKGNVSRVVSADTPGGKKAKLNWKKLETREVDGKVCSLLDIELFTGRHHQIRVQLSNAGWPLLGDLKYGTQPADQLALCAYRLKLRHPKNGKEMEFTCQYSFEGDAAFHI